MSRVVDSVGLDKGRARTLVGRRMGRFCHPVPKTEPSGCGSLTEASCRHEDRCGIRPSGASTFGAPATEQVTGIPLRFNLLPLDPRTGKMTVSSRKKEKPEGAWSADAPWGDKSEPKAWYRFAVPHYRLKG